MYYLFFKKTKFIFLKVQKTLIKKYVTKKNKLKEKSYKFFCQD